MATAYCVETKEKQEVNAITGGQAGRTVRNKAPGKPWKKFKGFCKNCGIQGHKAVNCTRDKGTQEKRVQKETRKCYNCNKVGHLAKDCTRKPTDTAFVGCILINEDPKIDDKKLINSNEFDPIKELSWINIEDLANELEKRRRVEDRIFQSRRRKLWSAEFSRWFKSEEELRRQYDNDTE